VPCWPRHLTARPVAKRYHITFIKRLPAAHPIYKQALPRLEYSDIAGHETNILKQNTELSLSAQSYIQLQMDPASIDPVTMVTTMFNREKENKNELCDIGR
jgi:fibrillarin-like rRNA methylase